MKAIRIGTPAGLEQLQLVEMEDPGAPGPGEIRVRVHGSSLNRHDFLVCAGKMPTADGRIPLSDAGGVVEAVGEGVTEFAVGDRVISTFFPRWIDGETSDRIAAFSEVPGDGIDGYAREVVVRPATAFTRAPRGWDHVEAATVTTAGLTAWRALVVDGPLKAGEVVLVQGTGGFSLYGLQLAKAMGATVIATSSSDEKLERLRALGADHTINYKTHEDWGRRALDWTGGRGVDHVLEVGGPRTLDQSAIACRAGGHIAFVGALSGFSAPAPLPLILARQIRFQGLMVGSRAHQLDFVRALEATGIKPVMDRTFPLDQLAEAFRHERAGLHFGKIGIAI